MPSQHGSFRERTRENVVPIVKKLTECMGTAFPMLKYRRNALDRCCKEKKILLLVRMGMISNALHHVHCNDYKTINHHCCLAHGTFRRKCIFIQIYRIIGRDNPVYTVTFRCYLLTSVAREKVTAVCGILCNDKGLNRNLQVSSQYFPSPPAFSPCFPHPET